MLGVFSVDHTAQRFYEAGVGAGLRDIEFASRNPVAIEPGVNRERNSCTSRQDTIRKHRCQNYQFSLTLASHHKHITWIHKHQRHLNYKRGGNDTHPDFNVGCEFNPSRVVGGGTRTKAFLLSKRRPMILPEGLHERKAITAPIPCLCTVDATQTIQAYSRQHNGDKSTGTINWYRKGET